MPAIDILAVFLPLAGALAVRLTARSASDKAACWISFLTALATAGCALAVFWDVALLGHPRAMVLAEWIRSGEVSVTWGLRLDFLSSTMAAVVAVVSALTQAYAIGYMAQEGDRARFLSYLNGFTFFMLALVFSNNLAQLFFGWEGVGLMSYLLIGFWRDRDRANAAAIKAFLVNRVGDAGFVLGLCGFFVLFRSFDFDVAFAKGPLQAQAVFSVLGAPVHALTAVCLLLFWGAMAKSAQMGLHTWLPDAMEGPTPASALIHAATMVAAGVFLLARLAPLLALAPMALAVVAVVGALTAFLAALAALVQVDIKRVIAWSTISQLGYMFIGLGVGASGAAMFHLTTHAFFKALLFFGAGSVIHGLHGEQNLRKMGGLGRDMPITCGLMWMGALALAGMGVPGLPGLAGFAGFYSKEAILSAALVQGSALGMVAYGLGAATVLLTAFYAGRLMLLTFHGPRRSSRRAHESPAIMWGAMIPLAVGAALGGWGLQELFTPANPAFSASTSALASAFVSAQPFMSAREGVAPWWLEALPSGLAWAGLALAMAVYAGAPKRRKMHSAADDAAMIEHSLEANWDSNGEGFAQVPARPWAIWTWPQRALEAMGDLHWLLVRGYGIDAFYEKALVAPALALGRSLWQEGDRHTLDERGVDATAALAVRLGKSVSRWQSGRLTAYAFAMMAGVAAMFVWIWTKG